jgi:N-hydroxyarylamine O-acetyltransferase
MPDFDGGLFARYLDLLEVHATKPDLKTLEEIVKTQLTKVPFENISKLYFKKRKGLRGLIGFEDYLDGIEHHGFGGTCYANNYYLYCLLTHLGYDVRLCGADMTNPDVHIVSMVKLEDREFIVDGGYGAPFLKPLSRNESDDVIIALGNERYVLKPKDEKGCSRLQMYVDGNLKHGYLAKPDARRITDFAPVIRRSFDENATFMNAIVLIRFDGERSYAIHNFTFTESSTDRSHTRNLANRDELTECIADVFSISPSVTREALKQVPRFYDVWD